MDTSQKYHNRLELANTSSNNLSNPRLVANIAKHFFSNSDEYSWDEQELTIEDEAAVLKLLRTRGIELLTQKLKKFPTSISDLKTLAYVPTTYSQSEICWYNIINRGYIDTVATILAVCGIVYFYSNMFWYSLLLAYFVCSLIMLIIHEGWAHNYVTPKNRYIRILLDQFANIFAILYSSKHCIAYHKTLWRTVHGDHHSTWLDHNDPIELSTKNNWVTHIFFKNLGPTPTPDITERANRHLNSLPLVERLLEKYSSYISLAFHLLFLYFAGLEYYFYFVFIQIWYVRLYYTIFSEVIPHRVCHNKTNLRWLFPILLCQAYHVDHHKVGYYLGPSWANIVNVQWWYVKLLFNERIQPFKK